MFPLRTAPTGGVNALQKAAAAFCVDKGNARENGQCPTWEEDRRQRRI